AKRAARSTRSSRRTCTNTISRSAARTSSTSSSCSRLAIVSRRKSPLHARKTRRTGERRTHVTFDLPLVSFSLFGTITVPAALSLVSVTNPGHGALCLVLTFFSTACTWLLADAEFLAIALVLVYVGAVMVLFLFVVMMLDIDLVPLREGFVRAMPVGLIVAVVMLVEMLALIGVRSMQIPAPADPAAAAGMSNTTWLANALFSQFLLPFEVAALILTVAI